MLSVGTYPEVGHNSVRPALPRIHVQVDVPMFVHPNEEGWWSCRLADFDAPVWRTDDAALKPLGTLTWGRTDAIPIEAVVTDGNTNWTIRSVVHLAGEGWNQTAVGRIARGKELMPLIVRQSSVFGDN